MLKLTLIPAIFLSIPSALVLANHLRKLLQLAYERKKFEFEKTKDDWYNRQLRG